MKQHTLSGSWPAFIRKEYFEPDISRALLVTVALLIPLCVAHYLNKPFLGVFVAITSQLITSAKISGSYAQRAVIILLGTLAVAAAAFLGTLAGGYLWTAIIFMGLVAFLASLARGLGDYGIVLGISAVILFLISLRAPNDIQAATDRAFLIMLGGAWAAILLLFLWPVYPFLPFHKTIAKPWQTSSTLIKLAARPITEENTFETNVAQVETTLRQAINQVIPLLKSRRKTNRWAREDIHKIVGASSRFGATALGLINQLPEIYAHNIYSFIVPAIQHTIYTMGIAAQSVSDAMLFQQNKTYLIAQKNIQQAAAAVSALNEKSKLPVKKHDMHAQIRLLGMVHLFESALHYLEEAIQILKHIQKKKRRTALIPTFHFEINPGKKWRTIRLALQANSMLMKHSLRVMLVASVGLAIYYIFDIPRGYWIVLTVVVLLQPDFGTTKERTKNRLAGTLVGVTLGSFLLVYPFHFLFLILVIALCCFLFVYLQPKNYKLSVVFVTIMLVAIFEISEPIDWHIAVYRLLATTIGGILAISAAYVLWPSWESMQFPNIMAKALRTNKNYLLQIEYELERNTGFHSRIIADRRKAEVENINVLDSIKRLSQEPGSKQSRVKYAQKLAYHNSKLTRELTSFAAFLPGADTKLNIRADLPEVHTLIQHLAHALNNVALAVEYRKSIDTNVDFKIYLESLFLKISQLQQESQLYTADVYITDSTLLQEELLYTHLEKITDEITAMINLIQDNSKAVTNR